MKTIKAGYEILTPIDGKEILKSIEIAARTCYKSEDLITDESANKLVKKLIERGHEAMIEHAPAISVKYTCDRGVSHELVRHRLCSWAQESSRYCNYSKDKFGNEITVIEPLFFNKNEGSYDIWKHSCETAEKAYFELLDIGAKPEEARSVLPNSLKTEIVMTANIREWRHFFKLRTDKAAHPQIRELARPLLKEFQARIPLLFDDITYM